MKEINVPITIGFDENKKPITKMVPEKIYKINELSYLGKMLQCKDSVKPDPVHHVKIHYLEIPCAFDIETTNVTAPLDGETFVDSSVCDYLSKIKIRYSDSIKSDIADFEQIRRSYFGKLKLSKKTGLYIDELWDSLNEWRPDLFPDDIINQADMLQRVFDVYESNTPDTNKFRPYAFMYHWQFCLDDEVCFGRTWEGFQDLLKRLENNLNLSYTNRLVIWVHNLSFEWQFMRDFIDFEDGFFMEERQPAKILLKSGIEFRCSYILSNMSLGKFCENEAGVIHYKLDGEEYDYDKFRLPTTPLSEYEEGYCYNDVRGLCECIKSRLTHDTLASIPLTSTGYVRRELRANVRKNPKNRAAFLNAKLDSHLYTLCREAFRGGDTHANAERSDQLIENAWGRDIKSSYPGQIVIFDGYPISAWGKMTPEYYLNHDTTEYAILLKVAFFDIRYDTKSPYFCGMPYIPIAKCSKFSAKRVIDNGRVLYAEFLECTLTEIDFFIIRKEYKVGDIKLGEIYASKKGKLSQEIIDTTMDYFRQKTLLDGIEDRRYEYLKSKNRLNSIFGCMVMKIDQSRILWDAKKKIYVDDTPDLKEALEKFYKSRNNFLRYDQGLYITAAARLQLRTMLWKVGGDAIYCDTDSIKGIGDHTKDFEIENEYRKQLAIKNGAMAEDREGNLYYLGVWENETAPIEEGGKGLYEEFKTLGAKKYCYKQNGKITSTIAGVSKKAGAKYFTEHGVDGLIKDAVITESGHLTAYYNDEGPHQIIIDHNKFTTGSNVALVNNTYKIGITEEYCDLLLKGIDNIIDML